MKKNTTIPFIFQFLEERSKDNVKHIDYFFDTTVNGFVARDPFYPWDYANHMEDVE